MLGNNYVMRYALPIFQEEHAIQYMDAKFYNAFSGYGHGDLSSGGRQV